MAREATVTVTLREDDARWLLEVVDVADNDQDRRIRDELKHALAECECGEET